MRLFVPLCLCGKQEPFITTESQRHGGTQSKETREMSSSIYPLIGIVLCGLTLFADAQNQSPTLTERAYQDREILYELQTPESHAFRITHDYTVRKVGEKYYFNVVRAGSHVTDPESIDLDTGEKLKWEIINGKQATERKLPIVEAIKDDSEIVVTHLVRALEQGTTNRIRLMETYADPKSYYLDGEELVWDRTFGRLRNTVVLPVGWYLTALSSPATIQTLSDGRISIYVVNPRNDDVRVYFRARRRMPRP